MAQKLLQNAATVTHSERLSKVAALLQAENPFESVLKEIDSMIEVIHDEGVADKKNLKWCKKERKTSKRDIKTRKQEILGLDSDIDELKKRIVTLKALIEETETSLLENKEFQEKITKERADKHAAYVKNEQNFEDCQAILTKAIRVLTKYYYDLEDKLEGGHNAGGTHSSDDSLIQVDEKLAEPVKEFAKEKYEGQSDGGNEIIGTLRYIKEAQQSEMGEDEKDERDSRQEYDLTMAQRQKDQKKDEGILAKTQDSLAEAQKDKLEAEEMRESTVKDKEATEDYVVQIKPGCDFITKNFKLREDNRDFEKKSLLKVQDLISKTPAYKTWSNATKFEGYGDCAVPCGKDEADVTCKACMADVTIPAYCAGHKDTKGCEELRARIEKL